VNSNTFYYHKNAALLHLCKLQPFLQIIHSRPAKAEKQAADPNVDAGKLTEHELIEV